jgi:membrane fusion protein, multidrug efflux system
VDSPAKEAVSGQDAGRAKRSMLGRGPVILIGTLVMAVLFFLGLRYLADSFTHESTDDAFIDTDITTIAPRVAGQVKTVFIARNQRVKAGDPLLELDSRDFEIARDQKLAASAAARANVQLLRAQLELSKAQVASAEATASQAAAEAAAAEATSKRAEADLRRAEELNRNRTISSQEFDTARAMAISAEANWKAAQGKAASEQAKVGEVRAQVEASQKALERGEAQAAQADVDVKAAELNLSYTRITAPEDGQVTRKSVEVGNFVQTGQSLMALVPSRVFVTANFKETQLHNIRTNLPVKIIIDSVEGGPFAGHVESIQAGSGAAFSLLPPENAVGNFVKVVQRIPVRIFFDAPVESGHVLGPGMSVVPSVRISDATISESTIAIAAAVLALILGALWWLLGRRKERAA